MNKNVYKQQSSTQHVIIPLGSINTSDKTLAGLRTKERRQITNIQNERSDVSTESGDTKI